MILNFITCSGTNEFTDIRELFELMREYPLGEIAVQVSERQSPLGGPRLEWINELSSKLQEQHIYINAAMHINCTWVEEMCRGNIVPELQNLIELNDIYSLPLFKRLQLNFKLGRDNVNADCGNILLALQQRIRRRFILSYNESNAHLIKILYLKGLRFDCLFDSSFGRGIAPDSRPAPVFTDITQGYAGGITPDNVYTELNKIAAITEKSPTLGHVYVDAQKGLEDEHSHLSLDKSHQYLDTATKWYHNHRWNTASF